MSTKAATQIADLTALDCLALYKSRDLSPVDVIADCLQRIDDANPEFNAFCFINFEQAKEQARLSEARWMRGEPIGLLDGVPVTLKDVTLSREMPTRYGSKATSEDGPWDVDAPVSARLREAGSVILGKTTTPEFGWKGVTDSPLFGITRNPWNPNLTPGGSSGGAAVAAALNLGFLHQGSDGGGSIRTPASFTGTFGFKPTFGYVPQWPPSGFTTLSHIGPITRTVTDAALMMRVIAQKDVRDGYAGPEYPVGEVLSPTLKGLRVAYSQDFGYADVSKDILSVTDAAVHKIASLGAEITHENPGFDDPGKILETLFITGAARLVSRLDQEQRSLLDINFLKWAERGFSVTLSEYQDAQEARAELTAKMARFHQKFDLLVSPALTVAPFPVGLDQPEPGKRWQLLQGPFNLTQQPAASLPCGLDSNGLPVGLQLVGARYKDMTVLSAAHVLESVFGRLVPPKHAPA